MQGNYKLSNAFQVGLLGGLGVLAALLIGGAVSSIANLITYLVASIFIALGLEPIVTKLVSMGLKRPIAVPVTVVGILAIITLMLWSLVPTLADEAATFVVLAPGFLTGFTELAWVQQIDDQFGGSITSSLTTAGEFISDAKNWPSMLGGVVQVGLSIFNGFFGAIVIVILSLYFMASMSAFKRWMYSMVSASRRDQFVDLAEQISVSVGRYVMGQVFIGTIAAVSAFIFMSIVGIPFALVLAAITFLLGLIPLVGTITGAAIVTLVALSVSPTAALISAIYYLIYMQIEAYVISPKIMSKAVSVPGAVVVVAAIAGGAILGVLGALIAIPVAASIMLIVREVWMPRQEAR